MSDEVKEMHRWREEAIGLRKRVAELESEPLSRAIAVCRAYGWHALSDEERRELDQRIERLRANVDARLEDLRQASEEADRLRAELRVATVRSLHQEQADGVPRANLKNACAALAEFRDVLDAGPEPTLAELVEQVRRLVEEVGYWRRSSAGGTVGRLLLAAKEWVTTERSLAVWLAAEQWVDAGCPMLPERE